MFMAQEPVSQIKKPAEASSTPSAVEARMFTMPERYRHGAQASLHQPESVQPTTAPAQVETPHIPSPPKAPPKPITPTKKKGSFTKRILFLGVCALVLLSVAGFFVLRSAQKPSVQTQVVETPITRQAPEKQTSVEVEPIKEKPDNQAIEPDLFGVEIIPGIDTDSDGLTDTEEKLVYGTNPRLPDTDEDGFLDGNEVYHGYNPGGTAPGTLLESGLVDEASGSVMAGAYAFYYPSVWDLEESAQQMTLDTQTGEGFYITIEEKQENLSLREWVDRTRGPEDTLESTSKNGLPVIQSQDQLQVYIDLGSVVMRFQYDTGIKARVDYLQTLQMMLNSVDFEDTPEGQEQEEELEL
jgi:hypothetical protein